MSTKDNLKFYNADKYWNMDVKDEFMANTSNLWRGNFDCKHDGNIFKLTHQASEEEALSVSDPTLH